MSDSSTILYLDLNHWIELSKARLARPTSRAPYCQIYPVLQRLVHTGKVVTPLSEVHYAEMRDRIRSFDQRNELAITMAELSRYMALPPRNHVLPRQLRASTAWHFGLTARESGREQPTLAADVSAGEHDAIMQAIRAGNAEATSRLTIQHLTRGSDSLIQGLFPTAEPAEDPAPEVPSSTG
jgi:hypothetical protein